MLVSQQQLAAEAQVRMMQLSPPPIPFLTRMSERELSTEAKKKEEEKNTTNYVSFDIRLDPTKKDSEKIRRKLKVFENGSPEDYCKWRVDFDDLIRYPSFAKPEARASVLNTLLRGRARDTFLASHNRYKSLAEDESDKEYAVNHALNDVALDVFVVRGPDKLEKSYLRNCLYLHDYPVKEWGKRLEEINDYIPYFPLDDFLEGIAPTSLPEDELNDILNRAKPLTWHQKALVANIAVETMTWDEIIEYYEKLERNDALEVDQKKNPRKDEEGHSKKRHRTGKTRGNDNSERKEKRKSESRPNKPEFERKEACTHCGKWHVSPDRDCWTLTKNAAKKPRYDESRKKTAKSYKLTTEQVNRMIASLPLYQQQKPVRKRKVVLEDSSDDDDSPEYNNSLNKASEKDCSEYTHAYTNSLEPSRKKLKLTHLTTEVIVELQDRNGDVIPIRCLLDTGTSSTIILRDFVAKGKCNGHKHKPTHWHTMGGTFVTKRKALIDFKLPEFSTNKHVQWVCHVDDNTTPTKAQYDMIIGTDLMSAIGIDILFTSKIISWEDGMIPMKNRSTLTTAAAVDYIYSLCNDIPAVQEAESRQKRILDADYSRVDIEKHIAELSHLDDDEKRKLVTILKNHRSLFSGGLGTLNIKPIRLDLIDDAKPYHARAFPVPQAYEGVTKKEIERLLRIGVLKKSHESEWAAPTFIQPKKTGDVRVLTDFRQLNKVLKRRPFPLPKISDMLQKLQGFRYATAIDLSMGYYHIPLDEWSQRLCSTILPWGKYQYLRLPMGIKNSPDIFQSIMMDLLGDLEYARTYIDDILVTTSGTYEQHLAQVNEVLKRLDTAGFRVNVNKCSFAQPHLDYLGYWLTREGIQPQPKKVEAILRLSPPKTKRQLRHFLGMINYYRDMWKRRSHYSAPLTGMISKDVKFQWGLEQQQAFDRIKKVISRETLLTFPDFNKEFHIYTDASDYQLGAVIMQENKPLAFYSRKLNGAQRRYTTGEQELLSIVETLKEFKNILLGQKIVVHTDHQNIVYGNLSNDRIARWRLLLEEYGPTYVHVKGTDNVVADALSRMDADFDSPPPSVESVVEMSNAFSKKKDESFPMSPALISKLQRDDKILRKTVTKGLSNQYGTTLVEGVEIITHEGKLYVPSQLQSRVVAWYHEYLAHPGQTRLEATIRQIYTWPKLREHVHQYCRSCDKCQRNKKQRKRYGHLPAKEAETTPWKRINVDLIGPYTVKSINDPESRKPRELRALTMIDPVTGWFEIKSIPRPDAASVMDAFYESWICRYPRPAEIGFDNGSEFKTVFTATCANYGIKPKHSTPYNPQSNGIIERIHQVVGNSLRTLELEQATLNDVDPWSVYLASVAWAIRSTYHTVLEATPGQLVFGRDMVLPIQFQADWARIKMRKQESIDESNTRENAKRIAHDYKVGEQVLVDKPGITRKMSSPRHGPYPITKVYTNGTVRISRGAVNEQINVRRLTPYTARPH